MRLAISVDTTPVSMCSDCSAKIGHARRSSPGAGASGSRAPGSWETVVMGGSLAAIGYMRFPGWPGRLKSQTINAVEHYTSPMRYL